MVSGTSICEPFESNSLHALMADEAVDAYWDGSQRLFKIRAADSEGHRSSANILVQRRYAWRGYATSLPTTDSTSNRVTLIAVDGDETVGTMSVGFDGPDGLLVDDLFSQEVAPLRAANRKICEFTKLAMDSMVRSKRVLASLFHVAYIHGHRLGQCDDLLIEVNPRHVRFYERMLGFTVLGPERLNLRVNAPAVLLRLDFRHARRQIAALGGRPELGDTERSLYPYFFSAKEEAGIIARLREASDPAETDFAALAAINSAAARASKRHDAHPFA